MANDATINIGADSTNALSVFAELSNQLKKTAREMDSSMAASGKSSAQAGDAIKSSFSRAFSGIEADSKSTFASMAGHVFSFKGLVVTAGLALVQAFSFKGTIDLADGMNDLSKKTGVAVSQLSAWRLVVEQSGTDMESLANGIKAASKYMVEHGENLKKIGINAKTAEEVIIQLAGVIAKLNPDDPRRVALALEVLGKNGMAMLPALSEGESGLRKMLATGKELGGVNQEMAASADAFNDQMAELKLLSGQVFINIAKDLLPALNSLTREFMDAQKAAAGFWGTWAAFSTKTDDSASKLSETQSRIRELKKMRAEIDPSKSAANKINDFIFGDANSLDKQIYVAQQEESALKKLVEIRNKRIKEAAAPPVQTGSAATTGAIDGILAPKKGKSSGGGGKSQASDFDGELNAERSAYNKRMLEQGSYQEFSIAMERDFWDKKRNSSKMSAADRLHVSNKYYDAERKLQKEHFDSEIEGMKISQKNAQDGGSERIRIAGEIAVKVGQKYGIESKQYKAALDEMHQMAIAHQAQMAQLDQLTINRTRDFQLNQTALEAARIEALAAMGELSESKKLEALLKLKEDEFQIELKAETDKLQFLENDVLAYQAAQDRILLVKQKHDIDMAKAVSGINVAKGNEFNNMFAPISSAFQKSVNGMIRGTQSFKTSIKSMLQSVAGEYAAMGVKIAAQWAARQLMMVLSTKAADTAKVASNKMAATQGLGISAGAGIKEVMNNAYKAAAGAYQAIVGIPYVGPILAPAAAAVAFAGVAAFGTLASARGGYDIPAGINPMAQLHEKEMVLPQKQADAVRNMADGGMGGTGSIVIHTSGGDFIHKNDLAKMLKTMNRNFVMAK